MPLFRQVLKQVATLRRGGGGASGGVWVLKAEFRG